MKIQQDRRNLIHPTYQNGQRTEEMGEEIRYVSVSSEQWPQKTKHSTATNSMPMFFHDPCPFSPSTSPRMVSVPGYFTHLSN